MKYTSTPRRRGRARSRTLYALTAVMAAILLWLPTQQAEAQIGGAGVVFLMIEPDSRAAGMGNTGVAIADNASANFWNPAGLAFQRGTEVSLTHSNWLPAFDAGLFYEYLTAKHSVDGVGTFGAQVTFLNLGEHEGRDFQGDPTGTFRSYDLAIGVSYARQITSQLGVGVSTRFIYSDLAPEGLSDGVDGTGSSVSFDLSALYRSNPIDLSGVGTTISAGFNLANMGPEISYSDAEDSGDPLPTNLRFGYSLTFDFDEYNQLTFANDFNKMLVRRDENGADPWSQAIFSAWSPVEVCTAAINECDRQENPENYQSVNALQQMTIGTGLEYWYDQLFAIRSGYFYESPYNGNRQFLTFGAGLRYNIVGIDFSYIYALEEDSPLSDTMRFSLLLDFR
ncbi:MAG: type IX secretion system outer membrane channel protein PorV [Bacteroidetes bacterium]|nr:type IX secretion system outer membrane channel protein PorV [Bacteroidota bacterium]